MPECGRFPQRGRPYCWSCDPAVSEDQKRAARAARWRGRLIAPDFGNIGARVRYREAVAEATLEGEMLPPVAAVALKAVNDAGDDLHRDQTGLPSGGVTVIIDRLAAPAGMVVPPPRALAPPGPEPISTAPPPAAPEPPAQTEVGAEVEGSVVSDGAPMPAVEIAQLEVPT
jgi:hypothetical protein